MLLLNQEINVGNKNDEDDNDNNQWWYHGWWLKPKPHKIQAKVCLPFQLQLGLVWLGAIVG